MRKWKPSHISAVAKPRTLFSLTLVCVGLGAVLYLMSGITGAPSNPAFAAYQQSSDATTAGFRHEGETIVVPERSPLRTRLVIRPAEVKQITNRIVLPAAVEADPARTAKVLPALSGRIVDLKVALGDHVTKGQALAVIDSPDLAQAYDDDDKAYSALSLAKKALDRQIGLTRIHGGPTKDLEAAQDTYMEASAEYKRTQARLNAIGVLPAPKDKNRLLTITAPLSGTVTDLDAAGGTFINDATQPLMTISQLDRIWVTADVPEKDISFISKNQSVDVTLMAYPGHVFHGTVQFVSDLLEPDTRRVKVRISFENPSGTLKPNMFATATFLAAPTSQVVVPTSTLLMNNDTTTVFVEVSPWTFERREVEYGYDVNAEVAITKGIKPGDRVITSGGVLLND